MCVVSNKIKFCSCATNNVQKLKHYWVWHRYNKDKYIMIVGEVFAKYDEFDPKYKNNQNTILKRLTETDTFDTELEFKNNDVLEIVLNNNSEKECRTYCFKFKNGVWKKKKYYPFELESEYDEKENGKINYPLIKQSP
ncbi:hypothetical protein AAGV33_03140 [Flavobacterium sp. FBOR7N2.3]|uniref:Uncharacterized protein n=1 Tax=Flavobacterium magnesitis TaxID=3138077 RepID=A0ABV4TJ48_9FLAO